MSDIESQNYLTWWAKVKYSVRYGPESYEEVPVNAIQCEVISKKSNKRKRRPFQPKNLDDYNKSQWYIVWSNKDVVSGEKKPFWALIGKISGNVPLHLTCFGGHLLQAAF